MITTKQITEWIEGMSQEDRQEALFKLACDTTYECGFDEMSELVDVVKNTTCPTKMDKREQDGSQD